MIEWTDLLSVGLISARLILSVVFMVAGGAKLIDLAGERQALIDFGVPHRIAPLLAIALPLTELTIAFALIPVSLAWFGAVGALSLLLLFVVAIGINLALGRKPDCHCFGQLRSAPAGWSTLARNAVLASAAGLLVWQGRIYDAPSLVSWFGDLTTAERVVLLGGLLGLAALAGEAALLVQILKQQGRILLRLDAWDASRAGNGIAVQSQAPIVGLPIGSPAPAFRLNGLDGKFLTLQDLLASAKPVLLLFTNPNCGPCQALLPAIGLWQQEHSAKLTIALISEGTAADNRAKIAEPGLSRVLLQQRREVAEIYQAWGTPSAVVIRPDGAIGSSLAQGADAIRAVVAQSMSETPMLRLAAVANGPDGNSARAPLVPAAKLGYPAPELKFADLNGKTVVLSAFRGRKILLLFWNPRCGFCQRMLSDLQSWDADPPIGAPTLVVVSAGTVEDGRAMGLRSAILLDPTGQAGGPLGANGTPMGIVIDARGQIASEVAAGAEAVFELAGTPRGAVVPGPPLLASR
jgi:thiol-disulfide isomerase/thioredoxin